MRKIFKLAPSLLAVILLAACDSVNITVKEPSFASKGKSIDQATFRSEITQAYLASEFFQEDLDLNSKIVQFQETTVEKQQRAKNKKVYFTDEHTAQKVGVMNYDSEALLLEQEIISKEIRDIDGEETNSNKSGKTTDKFFYEVGTKDYANKVLFIDQNRKDVEVVKELQEGESAKPTFDSIIATQFSNYFNESRMMHFAETTEYYFHKFYKNNKMFTVSYKEKYETSEQTIINGHNVDVKKYYVTQQITSQVDFTEGAEAIRISNKIDTTCEILQDHSGYKQGEIIDVQNARYVVYSVAHRTVNLKPLDVLPGSGYILIN